MALILFIHIPLSELMILKCGGKAVFVVAEEVYERSFDLRSFRIHLGVMRATRAAHDIDHAAREFPTGGEEFRAIPVIELQSPVRQFTPGIGLSLVQVCFVDSLETQMIDVPWFPTRRAANIHVWSPSGLILSS
jgi:hypothetical protein